MNKLIVLALILGLILSGCSDAIAPVVITEEAATQAIATETIATMPALETAAPTVQVELTPAAIASEAAPQASELQIEDVIAAEMEASFQFFWEQANTEVGSPGYGLIRDRYPGSEGIASIASVGFGLTAYPIGIEKGYITYDEGLERAEKTLDTLLAMDREEGFYYHFVSMDTGKRAWESEVSSIDTSILLMGVLTAGEYFGGDVQAKAQEIYAGVNWPWFLDESRNMFYMAYRPGKGFDGHWDFYAEQLMMYVLAAGSDTYPVDEGVYYTFTRDRKSYGQGDPFIHSWFGSIFTYQFSHAWIDFREYADKKGVNWFDNSVDASQAQYDFAVANDDEYLTLGPDAWGLSACDGPSGYNGLYGAPPSGFDNASHLVDDTVPPYGAIGSIIFLPEQAQEAMLNYASIDELAGPYGFRDAYNLSEEWFADSVIGIDKGITLLMLANYEDEIVHRIVMKNQAILDGLDLLGFTKAE